MVMACLRDLSDRDFQQRVWVRGEGAEVSSLIETLCELFDDSGLGMALEQGTCVYDTVTDCGLRELGECMGRISRREGLARILESREWMRIVQLAAELRTRVSSFTG